MDTLKRIDEILEIANNNKRSEIEKRALEFVKSFKVKNTPVVAYPYTVARLAYEFYCKETGNKPDDIKHTKAN
jgi:hypothetical protein